MKTIAIKCTGSRCAAFGDLEVLQGELKDLSEANYQKLRRRIETMGFDSPFFVWKNKVLDGTRRVRVLTKMLQDGWQLPGGQVPVCDIEVETLVEAKSRILGYISQYGRVSEDGLYDFIQGMPELKLDLLDLPNFDLTAWRYGHLEDGPEVERKTAPKTEDHSSEAGEFAVVCECSSATQQEEVFDLLAGRGYKCRVMTIKKE